MLAAQAAKQTGDVQGLLAGRIYFFGDTSSGYS